MSKQFKRSHRKVDQWLESLGFYRKCTARDETCLFRVISEQVYSTQRHHEKVRMECINYMKEHRDAFQVFIDIPYEEYIRKLECHQIICGRIEIVVASLIYERDVIMFDGLKQEINNVTERNLPDKFLVCKTTVEHYESVFHIEHIENAAFCQSIVYRHLYENIFKIKDLDLMIGFMLGTKDIKDINVFNNNKINSEPKYIHDLNDRNSNSENESEDALRNMIIKGILPFSFKVAKALDPTIYRNIEFDTWNEVRREIRYSQWYTGGTDLREGVKCIVHLKDNNYNEQTHLCYIQSLSPENEKNISQPCVVYVEDLAKLMTVNRSELEPLPQASPWPVPLKPFKNCCRESFHTLIEKKNSKKTKLIKSTKINKTIDYNKNEQIEKDDNQKDVNIFKALTAFQTETTLKYAVMPASVYHNNSQEQPRLWRPGEVFHPTSSSVNSMTSSPVQSEQYEPVAPSDDQTFQQQHYMAAIPEGMPYGYSAIPTGNIVRNGYIYVSHHGGMEQCCPGTNINYNVPLSMQPNGSDLPLYDMPTMRYFFNMGVKFFHHFKMHQPELTGTPVTTQGQQLTPVPIYSPDSYYHRPSITTQAPGTGTIMTQMQQLSVSESTNVANPTTVANQDSTEDMRSKGNFNKGKKNDHDKSANNKRQWDKKQTKTSLYSTQQMKDNNWSSSAPVQQHIATTTTIHEQAASIDIQPSPIEMVAGDGGNVAYAPVPYPYGYPMQDPNLTGGIYTTCDPSQYCISWMPGPIPQAYAQPDYQQPVNVQMQPVPISYPSGQNYAAPK